MPTPIVVSTAGRDLSSEPRMLWRDRVQPRTAAGGPEGWGG